MNIRPGEDVTDELNPNVAAAGAIYGDTDGKYASFLAHTDEAYPAEPYFLWNQPLSDGGWVSRNPNYGGSAASDSNNKAKNGTSGSGSNGNGSSGSTKGDKGSAKVIAGTISLAALSVFAAWLLA